MNKRTFDKIDNDMIHYAKKEVGDAAPYVSIDLDGITYKQGSTNDLTQIRLNGEAKSGTTWLEYIMKHILFTVCDSSTDCTAKNDFQEKQISMDTHHKIIQAEFRGEKHTIPGSKHNGGIDLDKPTNMTDQEIQTSADKYVSESVTSNRKYIAIFRDPRSVIISTCYHKEENCPAADEYTSDNIETASKWINLRWRFWNAFEHLAPERVMLIFYEDLKTSGKEQIKNISKFLGMPASDDQIQKIYTATSFENMKAEGDAIKQGKAKSGKVREGEMCNYKNELSAQAAEKVTAKMRDCLARELNEKWSC